MNFQCTLLGKKKCKMCNNKNKIYIIITPAYNEQKFIQCTMESVIRQTIVPERWIIVDDGSTDKTAEIIRPYSERFKWIKYVKRIKNPHHSYYGSNVYAIKEGLNHLNGVAYRYLAILDADIELCVNYYEKIIGKLERYESLGIATGTYLENEKGRMVEAKIDRRSTPKAIQVFRRECYEQTGGYYPFPFGGEDSGIEIMARMNNWATWSFDDIKVIHNRPVGTVNGKSILKARFGLGITDYCMGTHPAFMIAKCIKRSYWERPYLFSALARLIGYLSGYTGRYPQDLPENARRFLRKEQTERLIALLKREKADKIFY